MSKADAASSAPRLFAPLPDAVATSPNAAEREVLREWTERRTFEAVQRERAGAAPFVFWEGPPTANGRPGIHHVLARTIKDAVCRFQTMRGRRVDRKAGWDTHGLPVELEVEKKLGISGKPQIEALPVDPATGKGGVARFNDECRKSVWTYKKEWEELSARIGYWLDYAHPYVTYEPEYIDSIWYLLARMHAEGLVYRGKKVLPYCGRCGTGLSSHELGQPGVYRDVQDPSVTVRFRMADAPGESLLAWTTTPWTLPSNFALVVHPDRDYVRARVPLPVAKGAEPGSAGSEIVWVVRERAKAVLGEHEELEVRKGRDLVGRRYLTVFDDRVPFEDPGAWTPDASRIHTVFPGAFVTVEEGTGIVHQAPYGADDWETARAHRLPLPLAVGRDGRFACAVDGVAAGTFFKEADDALMDSLKARHLLFRKAREPHSYPHCWRCDTALFYFPIPAWFLRTTRIKDRMIEQNRRVRWVPAEVGEKRFGEWLENNIDWNISRDRYWGTPLPFWVCANAGCNEVVAVESRARLDELVRARGGSSAPADPHKPGIDAVELACPKCKGAMRRTPAVLDCWFDSGAMPYAQHGWPHVAGSRERLRDQFPADFIAEGLDQTRGWFYTLHAIGAFVTSLPDAELPDGPAYRSCVVNGLVLDKDGVKMSKRLGNVVDPWKLIDEHGADALRWYLLASGQPWLPKRFDPAGVMEGRRKLIGTLVNSYKFLAEYARVDRFDPSATAGRGSASIPESRQRPEIDRWLISRTQSLLRDVSSGMEACDLGGVCATIEAFVVDDMSNWYIRRNRRRFWKSETGKDKLAAFATLHEALSATALCCAPILPFLSELLWRRLSGTEHSVHASLLPEADLARIDPALEESMRVVTRIVEMGRALRERAGIRIRQPLRAIHVRSTHAASLELLRTPFATELVLGELNVKSWGSLAADDGELCSLRAKANFRTLGKRVGPRMKTVASRIESLTPEAIARLRGGGEVSVEADGETIALLPDDVQITVESRAPFDVETDGRFVVFLDTHLDDELVVEGLAREVINRINGLRKEAGFAVEDRIHLRIDDVVGAGVRESLEVHGDLIRAETLAHELRLGPIPDSGAERGARDTFDLGEGRRLTVGVLKA